MQKFINMFTHSEMWVADERVNEYIEAGHAPVSDTPVAKEPNPVKVEKAEKKPASKATKTATTRKTTTKKR